jgi:hypothetical protein
MNLKSLLTDYLQHKNVDIIGRSFQQGTTNENGMAILHTR